MIDVNGNPGDETVGALFDNLTTLNAALTLAVEILSFNAAITSDLFTNFTLLDLGPVFETDVVLVPSTPFATLFDQDFALINFNTDTGNYGIDASLPA